MKMAKRDRDAEYDDVPYEFESKSKKKCTDERMTSSDNIYFVDWKQQRHDPKNDDFEYILEHGKFPEQYKELNVNGDYKVTNLEAYSTTFTDTIEFDCETITENVGSIDLSLSIAKVSKLKNRELKSYLNEKSGIADDIYKSCTVKFNTKSYYIVIREKNCYSLYDYMMAAENEVNSEMSVSDIIRKLGILIINAHSHQYVIRQIFPENISLRNKQVKFHELSLLSHIKQSEPTTNSDLGDSKDEIDNFNELNINNKMSVSYDKNEYNDINLFKTICSQMITKFPKYLRPLVTHSLTQHNLAQFVVSPWLSNTIDKTKDFFSQLNEIIKTPTKFATDFTETFKNRKWYIGFHELKENSYTRYNTNDGNEFVRFFRNMVHHMDDFETMAASKNVLRLVIQFNMALMIDIHEYCLKHNRDLTHTEYEKLEKFIRVSKCDSN